MDMCVVGLLVVIVELLPCATDVGDEVMFKLEQGFSSSTIRPLLLSCSSPNIALINGIFGCACSLRLIL